MKVQDILKESFEQKKNRADEVYHRLEKAITKVQIELDFTNGLELLVATILAAQCTDKLVNKVTAKLFKKYKSVDDYAKADLMEMQRDIVPVTFYKNKAGSLIKMANMLKDKFGGKVPGRMEDLVELPGVGRKTANVVLGNVFGIPGIVVDTHNKRVSNRLNFTQKQEPEKIEIDLMKIIPENRWIKFSHLMILHGRYTCVARAPKCSVCVINELCPSRLETGSRKQVAG